MGDGQLLNVSRVTWFLTLLCFVTLARRTYSRPAITHRIRIYLHLPKAGIDPELRRNYKMPWQINQGICPPSLCAFHEDSGTHTPMFEGLTSPFFQGDIVVDNRIVELLFDRNLRQQQVSRRRKRAIVKDKIDIWPNATVPFLLSKSLEKNTRLVIRQAMQHIEERTCIRFRKRLNKDHDFLFYVMEPGCWSKVGRVSGKQKISLGHGCDHFGTALHETMHALGFWHEQSRPDRDEYVKIHEENVSPAVVHDFHMLTDHVATSRGYAYDYGSLMHYSRLTFTQNAKPTIEVIGPGKRLGLTIGQRDRLSNIDIAQLNAVYRCNTREDAGQMVCARGWIKFKRSCYNFIPSPGHKYSAANKACHHLSADLVIINTKREDNFLRRYLSKHFNKTTVWRTAGRKYRNRFAWFRITKDKFQRMKFRRFSSGHPGSFTSLALVRKRGSKKYEWKGVWTISAANSLSQYGAICERLGKRKCLKLKHTNGQDYRGQLSHTRNGITCQNWTSQWPHTHTLRVNAHTIKSDGLGNHNYCRNPTSIRRKHPWCYTTKTNITWEFCDISSC